MHYANSTLVFLALQQAQTRAPSDRRAEQKVRLQHMIRCHARRLVPWYSDLSVEAATWSYRQFRPH